MKIIFKIGKYLLRLTSLCLVSLIPKNRYIWVFGAWFGRDFSDNPKYMYQYVASLEGNIKPIWITKDKKLAGELQSRKTNAFYYKSIKGIYYQVIAKVVFVGHSVSADLNPAFIAFNTKRVQLWHGIPFKKIGFDDDVYNTQNSISLSYPKLSSLLTNDRYDMVTSTGRKCSNVFSSAFNISIEKCVITGFPRNDVFFTESIKRSSKYKVIYMPTFRGEMGDEFNLFESFGFQLREIEEKLAGKMIELHIRTHPANSPSKSFLKAIKNSRVVKISTISDIYEDINDYDCLVTDYSSIMFDFILNGKPIIFAPFDLENYLKEDRQLYCDYSEISNQVKCLNWQEVINEVVRFKHERNNYSNEFLQSYHDCKNTEENIFSANVFNAVIKFLE